MSFHHANAQARRRKHSTASRALAAFSLFALLCAVAMSPASAWADDGQAASEESDVLWSPHVSITAEPDPQNPGYLRIQATGTNDSPTTVRDANLEFAIPEQLVVVKGDKTTHTDALNAGESITSEIIAASAENMPTNPYQEPSGSSLNAPSSTSFAKTNDTLRDEAIVAVAIGIVATASVAFALRRRAQARKTTSAVMSVVLAGALVAGLTPILPQTALADEAAPATTGYASTEIDVNGTPVELGASLSIASADEVPKSDYPVAAWLSTETYVAHNATKAHVTLTSDKTFAATLDASSFSLGDALADCTVTEISRVSDTQANLVIEGLAASDGADGSIHATATAFADGVAEGFGVIPVETPIAALPDADEDVEEWNGALSLFLLPVYLDCAEFSATADASAFSIPANPAITVQDIDCAEGDHEAVLNLSVPGDSPEEQFRALDAALSESGVLISAAATNCGELTAVSHNASYAPEYGDDTTALEHANATFFAHIRATNARAEKVGGPVTLECEATIDTADGGLVDLTKAASCPDVLGVSFDESGSVVSGPSIVDQGTLTVTGENSFTFEATLEVSEDEYSIGAANVFWALLEDEDQCGNPLEHLQEAAAQSDWVFSSCTIELGASCASNRWGVPLSGVSAPVLPCDESATFARNSRDGGFTDGEVASKALSATQDALNAAGYFAKAIATKDYTEIFFGVGSVLGFVSKLTDISSPPQYTLADVMERLDTMQESLNTIESGVTQLGIQLESIESRSAYRAALAQLSSYTGILGEDQGIASMIDRSVANLSSDSDASSFAELSETDQKELRLLAESTRAYSQRHDTETLTLTKGLGDLITGNSAISATDIGSLYFDYVDTYYNWEPQTFDIRKQFLAYVGTAYINGYTASMCELNVELADAQAAGDEARIRALESAQKTLAKQAGKVGEVISGQVDETGKLISESNLSSRTHARSDGGVLNLVTKSVFFAKDSTGEGLIAADSVAARSGMDYDSVLKSRDIGRVNIETFDTAISEAQFVEMGKRLKDRSRQAGYTGPKNLSEEFDSLQIPHSESYGSWSYNLGSNREAKVEASEEQAHQHVVKLNPKKSTSDYFAVYHEIAQTGDVYDTKTDTVKRGVRVYRAWTKYYAGKFYWTLNIRFGDYRTWGATAAKNDAAEEDWENDDNEEWDDDMVTD